MERQQFEHLIESSGLRHIITMSSQLCFVVSLQVGTRILCDTFAFGRDEFESMTQEEAQFHIDACKSRMENAARLKTPAWLYYPEYLKPKHLRLDNPQRQAQPETPVIATVQAVRYPAH